jgi:hypothetical protein
MKTPLILLLSFPVCLVPCFTCAEETRAAWKKHIIEKATVETSITAAGTHNTFADVNAVVANDFNKDGSIDVMASFDGKVVLYKGPKWEKKIVLPEMPPDKTGRVAKRGCIHGTLMDVDHDGDMDFIGSNRMLFWLECPDKPFEEEWVCRMINLEINGAHCVTTGDVDRDGKIDLIANSWRDKGKSTIPNSITWLKTPKAPLSEELWSPNIFAKNDAPGRNHYMGFGDVNQDGRGDIACGAPEGGWFAWWEQPLDPSLPWKKHLLSEDDPGATNILPADLNGDGKMDFVASRGHEKGVLWFKGPDFTKLEIDKTLDTPHCLAVADLDGDGDIDFASCSSSLDGLTAWYENDGKGHFKRHVLDENQSSYDIRLVDLDRDGDLDILIGGHSSHNIVWYENPLG